MNTKTFAKCFGVLAVLGLLAACGGGGGGGGSGSTGSVSRYAYTANFGDNTVSSYAINATTGQLRHNGYVAAGANPHSVAVHPSGNFVYVTNFGNSVSGLSAYRVEAGGRLSPFDSSVPCGNCGARSVTITPSGNFLYIAYQTAGAVEGYRINADGSLTSNGGVYSVPSPISMVIDRAGLYAYVTSLSGNTVSAFRIDSSGALVSVDTNATDAGTQSSIAAGNGASNVLLDPTGRFAYVANYYDGSVSAFRVDASSGALTSNGTTTAANGARRMAVHASGKFLYVANHLADSVSLFTIHPDTGVLTGAGTVAGSAPTSVSIDASGKYLYATYSGSDTTTLYSIDPATGTLTNPRVSAGRSGNQEMAMTSGAAAVQAVPKSAYVVNRGSNSLSAYSIDARSGAVTGLAGSPYATAGIGSRAVAVDPSRKFAYVVNQASNNISAFSINPASGALTAVTGSPFASGGTGPRHATVDPSGQFLFVANFDSGSIAVFSINVTSGELTAVTGSPFILAPDPFSIIWAPTNPFSLTIDPRGRFLYVGNMSYYISAFAINANGALSEITGSPFIANSGTLSIAVDPSGQYLYSANYGPLNYGSGGVSAFTINATSGALTQVTPFFSFSGQFFAGTGSNAVTIEPSGRYVYVSNEISNNIAVFGLNAATGALTAVSGSPFAASGTSPHSATVDPSGQFLFTANEISHDVSVYRLSPATGNPTAVGSPFLTSGTGARFITITGTLE